MIAEATTLCTASGAGAMATHCATSADVAEARLTAAADRSVLRCLVVLLGVCAAACASRATTIDKSARPVALLADGTVLAQDTSRSMAQYDRNGKILRRFDAGGYVSCMAVTATERLLVMGRRDGGLVMCEIPGGRTLWNMAGSTTGQTELYDVSFAWDGTTLIAGDLYGRVRVVDSSGGTVLASALVPDGEGVIAVALSPWALAGAIVLRDGRIFALDVRSGVMQDTGARGGYPIQYSADGAFLCTPSGRTGVADKVRIIASGDRAAVDLGSTRDIGWIKPLADGTFLVTAAELDPAGGLRTVALRCDPAARTIATIWTEGKEQLMSVRMDCDPERMLGVSTDFLLRTTVLDLRTGLVMWRLDNSRGFEPVYISGVPVQQRRMALAIYVGAGLVLCVAAVVASVLLWRRARTT
jgi:hypothetical protein